MVCLLACSPALNWREARFDAAGSTRLLMPCKPDRAERAVVMGGQAVTLQMLGCDADGATFAVSHVRVAEAGAAAVILAGWRAAVLAHVQAQSVQELSWAMPGGAAVQPPQRLQAVGRRADGEAVALQAAWFSTAGPGGVHLFHALMVSPSPRADVADTFFSGLAAAP